MFPERDNYLLIPQSCGISMGNCTYTFGISILTPKPHDKLAYFRDGLSSGTLAKLINYPFVALRDLRPPLYKILLPSKPFEQPLKISFAF